MARVFPQGDAQTSKADKPLRLAVLRKPMKARERAQCVQGGSERP